MTGRMLLASPLGFLIGVSLGALGGGGPISPSPSSFSSRQRLAEATTSSLIVVGAASVVGAARH